MKKILLFFLFITYNAEAQIPNYGVALYKCSPHINCPTFRNEMPSLLSETFALRVQNMARNSTVRIVKKVLESDGTYTFQGQGTGVLINTIPSFNETGGGKFYLLTAGHTIKGAFTDMGLDGDDIYIGFNYELPPTTCIYNPLSTSAPIERLYNKGVIIHEVHENFNNGDFALLELKEYPNIPGIEFCFAPINNNPAGYEIENENDPSNNFPTNDFYAFSAHHPRGDVKRIAYSTNIINGPSISIDPTGPFQSNDGVINQNWTIFPSRGIYEGGSSGCGLFNNFGELIGIFNSRSVDYPSCEDEIKYGYFTRTGQIFSPNNNVASKICQDCDFSQSKWKYFNVNFGYCPGYSNFIPSCYDNELNNGEEIIDCGGVNCPACILVGDPNSPICQAVISPIEINKNCQELDNYSVKIKFRINSNCSYLIDLEPANAFALASETVVVSPHVVEYEYLVLPETLPYSAQCTVRVISESTEEILATETLGFTLNQQPNADAGADVETCPNNPLGFHGNVSGGESEYGFVWSSNMPQHMQLLDDPYSANPTFTPNVPGEYRYTFYVHDRNFCYDEDELVVRVTPCACGLASPPQVEAGPDRSSCALYPAVLSPTAGGGTLPYSYRWEPADGLSDPHSQSPTAQPAQETTYTVTVMDANGCTAQDEVTVTPSPAIAVDPLRQVCGSIAGSQPILYAEEIHAGGDCEAVVEAGATAEFVGRTRVWLKPGFRTNGAQRFVARIDPCLRPIPTGKTATDSTETALATEDVPTPPSDNAQNNKPEAKTDETVPNRTASQTLVRVFPNPSTGQVNVRISQAVRGPADIEVYDYTGRSVLKRSAAPFGTETFQLSLAGHPDGVYVVRVTAGTHIYTSKVVVVR